MKKGCLLVFCIFAMLALVCGCTDGTEQSGESVSVAESATSSQASSATSSDMSEQTSSEESSAAQSSEDSSAVSSDAESSVEASSEEESSREPDESSVEASSEEESSQEPDESSVIEESSEEPDESSAATSSEEESSQEPDESSVIEESSEEPEESSEEPDESSDIEESSEETSSETSSEIPSDWLTYEDTMVKDKNGNYTCQIPYGYTWQVDYINGEIVGEDVTICTTQEAYNACNPNWAVTIYAKKLSDGTYEALRDAIVVPGSAANAGIKIGKDQIAIVIHSAASRPNAGYENWEGKVVASSVRVGDIFEIDAGMTKVYAVMRDTSDIVIGGDDVNGIGDAEIIPTGYLLYNGAAYAQARYSEEWGPKYADIYANYAAAFPELGIHVINHPLSVINIDNAAVREMTVNQREVLNRMEQCIYGRVNFVNLGKLFEEHRGEYFYFKSDYHWTQLGAYYAYRAFAESVGLTPTELSAFEVKVINDKFIGHTNDYAHDDRILSFYDTIYAYMPTKEHTYAVYLSDMSLYRVYNNCIQPSINTYSCFLTGDQAFSIINVPENDQDKTVVVIKDSSANAFVPFLTEHYGNIIVIDPRHISVSIRQVVKDYGVDDIIFFATASTSNGSAYYNYYQGMLNR